MFRLFLRKRFFFRAWSISSKIQRSPTEPFRTIWLPYAVRSCKVTFNEILEIRKEDKIAEQRLVKKQVSKQELSVEWKIKGLLHHDAQFPTKTTNRVLTSLKSIGYTFLRHFVFTILWNSPSIVKITLPCHKVFDTFY